MLLLRDEMLHTLGIKTITSIQHRVKKGWRQAQEAGKQDAGTKITNQTKNTLKASTY
jgi:hypothetical protein